MAELEIRSVQNGTTLTFSGSTECGDAADDGYWMHVRLQGGSVSAATRLYDNHPSRWSRLFCDVAKQWRGWQGTKVQQTLEGDLLVSINADRLGHVTMRVTLVGGVPESPWRAEETIHLEAAQLDDLAARARVYFGESDGSS